MNAIQIVWRHALGLGRPWSMALCLALGLGMGLPPGMAQAATGSHQRLFEGESFAETVVVGDRTLRLNGLGLRGVAWIRAFVAGLYLAAPTADAAQILSMPGPKRLHLRVMIDAPARELAKSFGNGVRRNEPESVQQQLAERMVSFQSDIEGLGPLAVGDRIDVDFVPGRGAQLIHNDRQVGAPVPGDEFFRAILKIFIGERPVDARLKEGLLGGRPAP